MLSEKLAEIENDKQQREAERDQQKKLLYNEEASKQFKQKEKSYLQIKLAKYLPKVLEVNLVAKEMKRDIHFSIKLGYHYEEHDMFMAEDKHRK